MTQLDLFSLPATVEAPAGQPSLQQAAKGMVNMSEKTQTSYEPEATMGENEEHIVPADEALGPLSPGDGQMLSAVERAIIKTLESRPLPPLTSLQDQPGVNERTGDVVFEDSNITVKIKMRPGTDGVEKKPQPRKSIVTRQPPTEFSLALNSKLDQLKSNIKQALINDQAEKKKKQREQKQPQKRGRKSFKEIDIEADLVSIPEDEVLFNKQYYTIREVAGWFNVNTSLLRFWENEFDILKPRKNRKGDRMFRPEDVKNLQLIYQLLRQRKYSLEGAREFLKTNKGKADVQVQLTTTLQKFRSFLLEIKANL